MNHGKQICTCGTVISQCRCIGHVRNVSHVPNGCPRCKNTLLKERMIEKTPIVLIRSAVRRPREYKVAQYGPTTASLIDEWIRTAGNYVEPDQLPNLGDWVVKVTYPWSEEHEVTVYTDMAFHYWFQLITG